MQTYFLYQWKERREQKSKEGAEEGGDRVSKKQ